MTTFFTICALTRPRISVRSPPADRTSAGRRAQPCHRAGGRLRSVANRRISRTSAEASGTPGTFAGSNLNDTNGVCAPASRRQKLVRVVARISARYWRSTRSSERFATCSSAASIARTYCATWSSPFAVSAGSKRALKRASKSRAIPAFAASVASMKLCDSGKPICRRYFAYARRMTMSAARACAATTRRLNSSFSTSPRKMRPNASSNTGELLGIFVEQRRLDAEIVAARPPAAPAATRDAAARRSP